MWVPESACAVFLVLQCHLDIGPLDTSFSKHFQIYRKKKTMPKLIHWKVIGSLSLYCWNSHLDIFVCPCSCRQLAMKTILICLIPISTWNCQLWLEPCSGWCWINTEQVAVSALMILETSCMWRESIVIHLLQKRKWSWGIWWCIQRDLVTELGVSSRSQHYPSFYKCKIG